MKCLAAKSVVKLLIRLICLISLEYFGACESALIIKYIMLTQSKCPFMCLYWYPESGFLMFINCKLPGTRVWIMIRMYSLISNTTFMEEKHFSCAENVSDIVQRSGICHRFYHNCVFFKPSMCSWESGFFFFFNFQKKISTSQS